MNRMFIMSKVLNTVLNLMYVKSLDIEYLRDRFQVRAFTTDDGCYPLAVFDTEEEAIAFLTALCEGINDYEAK